MLEDEIVVVEGLAADDVIKLPGERGGGDPLAGVELGAVELFEFREAALRQRDPGGAGFRGDRGELAVEGVLLRAGEVLLRRGGLRVGPHPVGGKGVDPGVKGGAGGENGGGLQDEETAQAEKFHRVGTDAAVRAGKTIHDA